MILSTVAFLFLVETGAGALATLWLLRGFDLSRPLRRLVAGVGGGLLVTGLPFGIRAVGEGSIAAEALWARAGAGGWAGVLLGGYFLSAALLLGSTLGAMIVGHWYLVDRKMPIEPLRLASALVLAAVVARIAIVAGPAARFWAAGSAAGLDDLEALHLRVLWVQRALFGLAGPLVVGIMVWRTVRLRATQAATGLLYIVLFFVIVGELLSHYLLLKTDQLL